MPAYPPFIRRLFSFSLNLAPHAITARFTYTVPAGTRAELTELFLAVIQTTAAAAPASTLAGTYITINGAVYLISYNSQVLEDNKLVYGGSLGLQAGDVVVCNSFNLTAAINYTHTGSMSIKEYQ